MARGGYRPGAGRPRKDKSSNVGRKERKAAPRVVLVPPDGYRQLPEGMERPLNYMLRVMNDPEVEPARRDKMAIAAAPFCHQRVADNRVGKKETEAEAAKTAGAGSDWGDDLEFDGGRPN
jgi:hypothetical protein